VPMGSLAFVIAPIMVAMHRLTIHLPANILHHIARSCACTGTVLSARAEETANNVNLNIAVLR
jgi:hypothetical protein